MTAFLGREKWSKMSARQYTILFSCVGRRVALLEAFRQAVEDLAMRGRMLGADSSPYSPALQLCDKAFLVAPCTDSGYVEQLVEICRLEKVDLLIPLLDTELRILAGRNADFAAVGTMLCLSSVEAVRICSDKRRTHDVLRAAGIDTPKLFNYEEITDADLPLFMKPRDGSSARDIHKLESRDHLEFYHRELPQAIIQEYLSGQEYTLDIFSDFDGLPRCAVPRKRLEVRGGEVAKSMTLRDGELIRAGLEAVRAVPGIIGPTTLQCFRTNSGRISIIEINPRFGGGVPLAIRAGASIPKWTIQCALGESPQIDPLAFDDRLLMLRYDDAVFVREDDLPT